MPHVLTVRELTAAIKKNLESGFPFVWVSGQAGNVSRPGSGHLYFTIKDQEASLNCVWFQSNQSGRHNIRPETLQTGQALLCAGRITVYPPRGTYQLLLELVQDQGLGNLHLQFQALQQNLAQLGYFSVERKRALPVNPRRVGVITSPSGAALQDFLRLSQSRGLPCSIRIYPCLVQGEGSVDTISSAFEQANLEAWAEVLVLIRGGGSLEDLWSFNTEAVARAVFDSQIPVLTGIGHETDQTIAGLTADLNAATPTHAAQLLWTERAQIIQDIDEKEIALAQHWQRLYQNKRQALLNLEQGLAWLSPVNHLNRLEATFQHLLRDLLRSGRLFFKDQEARLQEMQWRMEQHNPLAPLERGYSLVTQKDSGRIVRSAEQVAPGEHLDIQTRHTHFPVQVLPDECSSS